MKNIVRPHSKGGPEAGHNWLNYSNFKMNGRQSVSPIARRIKPKTE
ncbi:hypothetical protein ABIF64_006538 [Bradyrhizobium japonicum]|nr:hypothetical protein [Bradyrhizobium japonicum]MCP1787772.1 hypothetical protein [Bradyrhizobium japonicum]MCP1809648.1 hypothetical protein [Bradyrhizobium japonicum]MCP1818582.1 hypothetical protein [Bradyrhizobium japonicum]MCP1869908.1 hypothetical protein [Bradyrhizobium japonicum]